MEDKNMVNTHNYGYNSAGNTYGNGDIGNVLGRLLNPKLHEAAERYEKAVMDFKFYIDLQCPICGKISKFNCNNNGNPDDEGVVLCPGCNKYMQFKLVYNGKKIITLIRKFDIELENDNDLLTELINHIITNVSEEDIKILINNADLEDPNNVQLKACKAIFEERGIKFDEGDE
jgi:hypothetical protein